MADIRENLIDILRKTRYEYRRYIGMKDMEKRLAKTEEEFLSIDDSILGEIPFCADYLLSNGVTVQGEIDANTFRLMRKCERLKEEKESLANAVNVLEEINSDLRKKFKGVTVQEWISVKDRLPEKDGHYLCNYHFGEYPKMTFTQVLDYYATDIVPHFQHTLGDGSMKVTHWMEIPKLPQPPKGE